MHGGRRVCDLLDSAIARRRSRTRPCPARGSSRRAGLGARGRFVQAGGAGASVNQNISARELLDQGASRIASQLAGDPATQAALFNVVGRLYSNLALHDAAIDVLLRALTVEQHERPQGSLTQAETMHWLAELYVRKNDYVAAERSFRRGPASAPARWVRRRTTSPRRSKRSAAASVSLAATAKRRFR